MEIAQNKTYNLEMVEDTYEYNDNLHVNGNRFSIADYDGISETRLHDIRTAITATSEQKATVTLYYKARGASNKQAKQNASYVTYAYTVTDSLLRLDDYFKIAENGRMNRQQVEILVALPEGTVFKVNSAFAARYRSRISNNAFDLIGEKDSTYKIKNGDLVCLDCAIVDENSIDENNTLPQKDSISSTTTTRGQWHYDGKDSARKTNSP
jgi:hypothetical protein